MMDSSCSIFSGCQNCTYAGCVWCGDGYGCHDHLSPYGCLYSKPCANITSCIRQKPQTIPYKDYSQMNAVVVVVTLLISLLFLVCIWTLFWFCRSHRRRMLNRDEIPNRITQAQDHDQQSIDDNLSVENISLDHSQKSSQKINTFQTSDCSSDKCPPVITALASDKNQNQRSLTPSQKLRAKMRNKYFSQPSTSANSEFDDHISENRSFGTNAFTSISQLPVKLALFEFMRLMYMYD